MLLVNAEGKSFELDYPEPGDRFKLKIHVGGGDVHYDGTTALLTRAELDVLISGLRAARERMRHMRLRAGL